MRKIKKAACLIFPVFFCLGLLSCSGLQALEPTSANNALFSVITLTLVTPTKTSTPKPIGTSVATNVETRPLALGGSPYESEAFGFRLQIPAGYRSEELPLRQGRLRAIGFAPANNDQTRRYGFPIGLTVYEKPPAESLIDWFSIHSGDWPELSEQAFFYAPDILNLNDFDGYSALQYRSSSRPVPYETLVDRGAWVIGFYYLEDYPDSYQSTYEQMLASFDFFSPTAEPAAMGASPLATATAVICLAEKAEPRALPLYRTPLEVYFISAGDIWVWAEAGGTAQPITALADVQSFTFSSEGKGLAFTRGPLYGQAELWGIRRDGTNLRLLASAEQLHALAGEPSATESSFMDEIHYLGWEAETQTLDFEIQRNYAGIGGCCESRGSWQVNVDTGKLSAGTPLSERMEAQGSMLSPDGRQVALITAPTVSLMNANGTNLRQNVFSFTTALAMEGGGTLSPHIEWAKDSQSLLAITFDGDVYSEATTSTTWRIPLDGSPARELHTFLAPYYWMYLSPDQTYLVYRKRVRPMANDYELHLATFDGSQDLIFAAHYGLEFVNWHPDSRHFVYAQGGIFHPFLGGLCNETVSLLDAPDIPATQIQWVDATRFLYVKGSPSPGAGPRELRLGKIGGPSILIGPFNGQTAQFTFNFMDRN